MSFARVCLSLILVCGAGAAAFGEEGGGISAPASKEDVKETLLALEKKYNQYCNERKFDELSALMSDDYLEVSSEGAKTKKEVLDTLRGTEKVTQDPDPKFSPANVRIVEVSAQAVLITYEWKELEQQISSLWVRDGKTWKCKFSQYSVNMKPIQFEELPKMDPEKDAPVQGAPAVK